MAAKKAPKKKKPGKFKKVLDAYLIITRAPANGDGGFTVFGVGEPSNTDVTVQLVDDFGGPLCDGVIATPGSGASWRADVVPDNYDNGVWAVASSPQDGYDSYCIEE
jgi:hypothetical protein